MSLDSLPALDTTVVERYKKHVGCYLVTESSHGQPLILCQVGVMHIQTKCQHSKQGMLNRRATQLHSSKTNMQVLSEGCCRDATAVKRQCWTNAVDVLPDHTLAKGSCHDT